MIPNLDATVLQHREDEESVAPADIIFAKADEAAADHRASAELDEGRSAIRTLTQEMKKASDEERPALVERLAALEAEVGVLEAEIEAHDVDDGIDEEEGAGERL